MNSRSTFHSIEALIARHDAAIAPLDADAQQSIADGSIVRRTVQYHLSQAAPDAKSLAHISAVAHAFLDSLHQPITGVLTATSTSRSSPGSPPTTSAAAPPSPPSTRTRRTTLPGTCARTPSWPRQPQLRCAAGNPPAMRGTATLVQ